MVQTGICNLFDYKKSGHQKIILKLWRKLFQLPVSGGINPFKMPVPPFPGFDPQNRKSAG